MESANCEFIWEFLFLRKDVSKTCIHFVYSSTKRNDIKILEMNKIKSNKDKLISSFKQNLHNIHP